MNREQLWVILGTLIPLAFVCLMFGAVLVGKLLGRRAAKYPPVGEGICLHGVWPDLCPSCRPAPAVVASDDLAWQVDLAKIYRDYDTYRTELRMPGERAS